MSTIRYELINTVSSKSSVLFNNDVNTHERYEVRKKIILADKSLTKNEKTEAIKLLAESYDGEKLIYNSGTKRICENCQLECLATLFCEYCVRNYLKSNFSNWTSGNDDI